MKRTITAGALLVVAGSTANVPLAAAAILSAFGLIASLRD